MKKHPSLCVIILITSLTLFLKPAAFSQTFTPRYNTSMTGGSNGFYEYLPVDYDKGTQNYPLLIFFHGIGERGDGGEKQLSEVLFNGTPNQMSKNEFPATFTANGKTFSFICLTPQFTGWPSSTDVNNIINYAIKNYRVDTTRIYLTGLSMGGGVIWDYIGSSPDYAKRIAAVLPVAGAASPNNSKCSNIAKANIAVWATHNDGDPTVPVSNTIGFVNGINSQNPPPTPLAKMTIFHSSSHNAWWDTYQLTFKENGLNVYEWMLQFQKSSYNVMPDFDLKASATYSKESVLIRWSVTEDNSFSGYTIERSQNGTTFTPIGTVQPKGIGSNTYQFNDDNPPAGNNLYRVRVSRHNGTNLYSNILAVTVSKLNTISLYPNPVVSALHIRSDRDIQNGQIKITDMAGKLVLVNSFSGSGDHSILLNLPKGMYNAVVSEKGTVLYSHTFMKQ